jgi:hypothetical protein
MPGANAPPQRPPAREQVDMRSLGTMTFRGGRSMNTTKWCACAALAASFGCASTPRMQPAPTPLFESNVRTDEVDDSPVETGRPELNTAPVPPKARLSDTADPGRATTVTTEPPAPDAPPAPAGTQGGQQERQRICDELRRGARMEVEETDDGARLWLRPSSRAEATRLRKVAGELAVTTAGDSSTTSAAPCALYQLLAGGAELRTNVIEDGSVRIEVRAADRTTRGHVRDELRRFAGTAQ